MFALLCGVSSNFHSCDVFRIRADSDTGVSHGAHAARDAHQMADGNSNVNPLYVPTGLLSIAFRVLLIEVILVSVPHNPAGLHISCGGSPARRLQQVIRRRDRAGEIPVIE